MTVWNLRGGKRRAERMRGSTGRFVEAESVVGTWASRLRGWRGEEGGGAVLSTAAPARVESGRLSRAESPRSSALEGSESTLQSS